MNKKPRRTTFASQLNVFVNEAMDRTFTKEDLKKTKISKKMLLAFSKNLFKVYGENFFKGERVFFHHICTLQMVVKRGNFSWGSHRNFNSDRYATKLLMHSNTKARMWKMFCKEVEEGRQVQLLNDYLEWGPKCNSSEERREALKIIKEKRGVVD